jgi:uncharacterized protein YkwD
MLRRALTIALALLAIVLGSAAPAAAAARFEPSRESASTQNDLIALINAYRASNGLQPVLSNGALTAAAGWMASDMAVRNYVGHVSSDGRSPTQRMSAFGYPATSMYTGEDLGAGYGTAGAVFAGWQASAAHNAVLLNPNYDAVGIGLVRNERSSYKWYWAADFGGPGGIAKVAPPQQVVADRAAPAPRGSDPALIARIEGMARRISDLFAALYRRGAI